MFPLPSGYDRAITVFSPEGRIFQVEYAMETVKRGSTVLGITCKDGVVLAAEERMTSKLQDPNFSLKIFQIDEHIGAAVAGLSSDARILIDHARIIAQTNRLLYDEPVDVEVLAKRIGDLMQLYTQHAGVRPFGVSVIFSGVDTQPKLYQTDPAGNYIALKASVIGAGSDMLKEVLENQYREDMALEEAIKLALSCLIKVIEGKILPQNIRIAIIPAETKKMRRLTNEEVKRYLEELGVKI